MPRTRALILGLTLAFAAGADDLVSGLVRNAWYWQARARSDKAEDAWKLAVAWFKANGVG